MSDTEKIEDVVSKSSCSEESNEPLKKEILKKPSLSFGINRILGERKSRSPSLTSSHEDDTEHCESDIDIKDDADVEETHSDVEPRSTSSSPALSPSFTTSKYDAAFMSQAHSLYPLDLTTSALLPLPGCGLYRSGHGIVKVPAQRPHTVLHMFNPYNIPWMDFRRDRFGGNV